MAEDKSDQRNPFFYLSGLVSFGPQRCGTPGIHKYSIPFYRITSNYLFNEL